MNTAYKLCIFTKQILYFLISILNNLYFITKLQRGGTDISTEKWLGRAKCEFIVICSEYHDIIKTWTG